MNVLIGCPNFRQINVILNERLKGYNFCHISGHGLKTTYEEMFLSLSSSHQFNVEIVWNCAKSSILSTQIDFLLTFFSLSRWKSFLFSSSSAVTVEKMHKSQWLERRQPKWQTVVWHLSKITALLSELWNLWSLMCRGAAAGQMMSAAEVVVTFSVEEFGSTHANKDVSRCCPLVTGLLKDEVILEYCDKPRHLQ